MRGIVIRGLKSGLDLTWTLGKIIFPITLLITILRYTPIFPFIMDLIAPLMKIFGLSGEAAVPLVLAGLLNLYAGIGAIVTLSFTVKEVFILAVMMSFAHNIIIESTVASKVGIPWGFVGGVKIVLAVVSAIFINLFWHGGGDIAQYGLIEQAAVKPEGWLAVVILGLKTAFMGVVQLAIIVIPLMLVMQVLKELNWLDLFSKWLSPFMKVLGIERNASMTLVAGIVIGLAYGAGLMIQAVKEDGVSKKDMYLVLIFLVSSHAIIEDTLIFVPLGIPVVALLIFRLIVAVVLTSVVGLIWNRVKYSRGKDQKHEHSYDSI